MIKQLVASSCLLILACQVSSCRKADPRSQLSREELDRQILLDSSHSPRTDEDFKSGATAITDPTMYVCDDTMRLRVDFDAPRRMVTVRTADGLAYDLVEKPVSSGIWYSADNADLRGPGTSLTWTLNDNAPTQCQIID